MCVIVGVFYWPPSWDDNKLVFKEPRDTSESTTLVLMGEFTLTGVNYTVNKQIQEIPKAAERKFLVQVFRELTQRHAVCNLWFAPREGLMGEAVVGGEQPHSHQVSNLWCLACTQLAPEWTRHRQVQQENQQFLLMFA